MLRQFTRSPRRHLAALALVCFGISASALCFQVLRSLETQKVYAQFRNAAQVRLDDLQSDLDLSIDKVLDLSAYCSSRQHLTRASFELFASQVLRGDSTIQALEWSPEVPLARRAAVERAARAEGLAGFEIRDRSQGGMVRADDRPSYAPVLYVYPQAGNEIAIGYDDLAGNVVRREVFQRAASSGELSASAGLVLAQETAPSGSGILLVHAVYSHRAADSSDAPATHPLLGFVEGVLRVSEIVRRHGESGGIALTIIDTNADTNAPSARQQLYPAPGNTPSSTSRFTQSRTIAIGGRNWRIFASPAPGAFPVTNWRAYGGSALCLLFTLMAAVLISEILGRNEKVERQVVERSRQLTDALTALEKVHRGLEEGEARYRRLIEDSPCAIVVERRGRIFMANRVALEMFNFDPDREPHGRSIFELIAPESMAEANEFYELLREKPVRIPPREMRIQSRDGRVLAAEIAASSFMQDGAHTIQIVLNDISQRKRDEAVTARLFTAIEQVRESIVITDPQARIVYVNAAFERITGYSREEAIGQNPRILKSGHQSSELYAQMWQTLARGEAWSGGFINRAKDGHLFTERATIAPVVNRSGELINYVAVKRDVTSEIELQEQLQQSQKMDAIGRLAGGVAHDFNNMLMVIVSYAELVCESLAEDDSVRDQMAQILNAAHRSSALTRQLLAFSRKQLLAPRVLDCNAIISETSDMVRRLISENIELRCDLAPGLWPVKADADQLVQVIVNLCVNSRDAMPEGGSLVLTTRNNAEQGCVEFSVADTGVGIPQEIQKKLFEPFFTTKEPGKGTGLGLATVYGIVQQSGGQIRVESSPGQGATFVVSLPRSADAAPAPEPPGRNPLSSERVVILVVEDEESLRQAIVKQLRAQGYQALAAADGTEALAVLSRSPRIGIVVCDLIMPRMGGRELARLALRQHPELRFIFMSGHPNQDMQPAEHPGQMIFMPKPFDISSLLNAIAEVHPAPCAPGGNRGLYHGENSSSRLIQ